MFTNAVLIIHCSIKKHNKTFIVIILAVFIILIFIGLYYFYAFVPISS